MTQQLHRAVLQHILQSEDIESLSASTLNRLFREEPGLVEYRPDGVFQIDPRNGERVVFNSARARRPHDNRSERAPEAAAARPCAVCEGRTTGVVDVADLSEGFTFINKNLYPVLMPARAGAVSLDGGGEGPGIEGGQAAGLHFLQWTSSLHDRDWHNMPEADRRVVMKRLAALERHLLAASDFEGGEGLPAGYVSVIKNVGHLVGGSLAHGHQQITVGNVMPRRTLENWRFQQERGEAFSSYMLRHNPADLLLKDYGPAILLTPYFMRRPYEMMLLVRDAGKAYLHELDDDELGAVVDGWHDATRAIYWLMPRLGRELAFNVITHNGPGAGLYFEFLPYTQETGGLEHLGLSVCQADPVQAAAELRRFLLDGGEQIQ